MIVTIPGISSVFEFVTLVNTSESGALFRFESYVLRNGFILGLVCVSLILQCFYIGAFMPILL